MSLRLSDSMLYVIKSSWFTRGKLFSQHDGRVGISGFSESVINGRHPGLVSGSISKLRFIFNQCLIIL